MSAASYLIVPTLDFVNVVVRGVPENWIKFERSERLWPDEVKLRVANWEWYFIHFSKRIFIKSP